MRFSPLSVPASAALLCLSLAASLVADPPSWKIGDLVVIRQDGAFPEGEIASLSGQAAEVIGSYGTRYDVDLADVTAVPALGDKPAADPGTILLVAAPDRRSWTPMKVESVDEVGVTLIQGDGSRAQVRPHAALVPPESWREAVEGLWARATELGAIRAESPPLGAGTPPKPGDVVLAEDGRRWSEVEVRAVRGATVVIVPRGEEDEHELPLAKVAPLPTATAARRPAVGEIVYWRDGEAWRAARVDAIDDEGNLTLTTPEGESAGAGPGEWVPQQSK